MKTTASSLLTVLGLLSGFTLLPAETPASAEPMAFSQIGEKATKEDGGRNIGISATAEGAEMRTAFQKLEGNVTRDGLRLISTEAAGGSLQLKTDAIGRVMEAIQPARTAHDLATPQSSVLAESGDAHAGRNFCNTLPTTGSVSSTESLVTFTRPGLVEEYRVTADGVRQDFIITARPTGTGASAWSLRSAEPRRRQRLMARN